MLVVALAASATLGALFVAKKPADDDLPAWPATPQPLRIDMPRDVRIAALWPPDSAAPDTSGGAIF